DSTVGRSDDDRVRTVTPNQFVRQSTGFARRSDSWRLAHPSDVFQNSDFVFRHGEISGIPAIPADDHGAIAPAAWVAGHEENRGGMEADFRIREGCDVFLLAPSLFDSCDGRRRGATCPPALRMAPPRRLLV